MINNSVLVSQETACVAVFTRKTTKMLKVGDRLLNALPILVLKCTFVHIYEKHITKKCQHKQAPKLRVSKPNCAYF